MSQQMSFVFRSFFQAGSVAALLWVCLGLPLSAQDADRELRFLGNHDLAPMIYATESGPKGVVVDLAEEIIRRAGLKARVEAMDWSLAQEQLKHGEADALLQINSNPEREKIFDFSDPLLESQLSIFRRVDRIDLQSMGSLKGRKVGVERSGYPYAMLKSKPEISLVIIPTWGLGMRQVASGELDAVVVDRWVGELELSRLGLSNVVASHEPLERSYSAIAVQKGNEALLQQINQALAEMRKDGSFDEIISHWSKYEVIHVTKSQKQLYMFSVLGVLGCLVLATALFELLKLRAHRDRMLKVNAQLEEQNEELTEFAERLDEESGRYELVIEGVDVGIWEWDIPSNQSIWSYRLFELLRLPPSEELDADAEWEQRLHPKDRQRIHDGVVHHLKTRRAYKEEVRVRCGDEQYRWFRICGKARFDEQSGRALKMAGSLEEISERKLAEAQLIEERNKAKVAEKAKSEFLANMSHEIRTPMNAIMGMAEMLAGMELGPEQEEMAQTIHGSAKALLCILNDTLDLAKIESGRVEFEQIAFDVLDVSRDVLRTFEIQSKQKNLDLDMSVAPGLSVLRIGDSGRIRQILMNLLSNAVKFTKEGRIHLQLSGDEQQLHLAVTDTGIGIRKEKQEDCFNSFVQADSSTTREFGGTGLGLPISRMLARLMGGDLTLRSEEGEGCCFTLSLPLLPGPEAGDEEPARSDVRDAMKDSSPAAKLTILVVEDNAVNQRVAQMMLRKLGHEVHIASSGLDGLEQMNTQNPDLIFMDCQMPLMDGYEATREIRKLKPARALPIIAMTAHAMEGDREKCLEVGMNDYITKPISSESLQLMLEKWS